MKLKLNIRNINKTAELARLIAKGIENPCIICLHGDLGAGKTEFAKTFIKEICKDENLKITSPTYTIAQVYEAEKFEVWHFDFYRLEDKEEVWETGFEEALESEAVIIMEWAEKIGSYLPEKRIDIFIENPVNTNNTNQNLPAKTDEAPIMEHEQYRNITIIPVSVPEWEKKLRTMNKQFTA